MVWSRPGLPHTSNLQQFANQLTLERGALIRVDPLRKSINAKVLVPALLRHLFSGLILSRESLRYPGKMVCHYLHIDRLVVRVLCSPEINAHNLQGCRGLYTLQRHSPLWISGLADDTPRALTDSL